MSKIDEKKMHRVWAVDDSTEENRKRFEGHPSMASLFLRRGYRKVESLPENEVPPMGCVLVEIDEDRYLELDKKHRRPQAPTIAPRRGPR